MVQIVQYNKSALKKFIDSCVYKNSDVLPISWHRAVSHIHNPVLNDNDIILFIAFDKDKIIGYRTLFADHENTIFFAWISGTWVHPDYRRKGIATMLFEAVYTNRNGMLMYTNYAPASKNLYDKTGKFQLYASEKGLKIFFLSDLYNTFKNRINNRFINLLLRFSDSIMNVFLTGKNALIYFFRFRQVQVNAVPSLTQDLSNFIDQHNQNDFTSRSSGVLQWIDDYPWVLQDELKKRTSRYYFTDYAKQFKTFYLYTTGSHTSDISGLCKVLIRDGMLKVPLVYVQSMDAANVLARQIIRIIFESKCSMCLIGSDGLMKSFRNMKWIYLHKRSITFNYYATKQLVNHLPQASGFNFQPGTGDMIFT